jgi:hypothetical protein
MRRKAYFALAGIVGLTIVQQGCSSPVDRVGFIDRTHAATGGDTFADSPDAATYDANAPVDYDNTVNQCPTNECPAGRTTCPNNPYPCAVDLLTDNKNCGECGHYCPNENDLARISASSVCIEGQCQYTCTSPARDCNGLWDDGCETSLSGDPNNCGGCGVVCPEGTKCSGGGCVCNIPNSCGWCGNVCPREPPTPLPAFPKAWHIAYGCEPPTGKCFVPQCGKFNTVAWADCNHDFLGDPNSPGDGCEQDIGSDEKNCGGCGIECGPGELCAADVITGIGRCTCVCGEICFDTSSDPYNCGGCGRTCTGTSPTAVHGQAGCNQGTCTYRCNDNWADCDASIENGCETDLLHDPLNCGGCGIVCNGIAGQACIDGHCATKDCGVK